ncbi:hypothetical protein [Aliarcobacter skirrowii]|uniref:hypothetical protein n=2 Tax=Aliarcobacter skirrowii TaxID=28200 RepID=UPI000D60F43A|nr:hypothetical protein [Aliarcobacter skirrowii]PWE19217.1 hypothetical protein DGF29_09345 [Aliarcobacter skirrowii]RJO55091.1 hypothetical protein DIR39_09350 [Aliarcobacter skirrowii]RJO57015.1 hypothetical protein DIR38_09515 [Aliarcobacter skirrowii]
MDTDLIYNYEELKLKLLKFSKYKILNDETKNIKFLDIKKQIQEYKNESNQKKKFITVFLISDNKVIMQYDERLDKFNLKIFDPYTNEKNNLKIIIYFFDTTHKNNAYINFLNVCENIKLKINFKNYISIFSKINLPISGFFSVCFTFFTIFALSEYGIPIIKVTDFHIIVILQMFSILFLAIFFSFSAILIIFLLIPLLLYIYVGFNNLFILGIVELVVLLITTWYLKKYYPNLLNKLPILIIKPSLYIMSFFSIFCSLLFLTIMGQSILSSFFPYSKFYNKSGYELAINEYITRFSGYPKILIKDQKKYYVPVVDSDYYYVYDIEKSKNKYLSDLKKDKMKSRLTSICEKDSTKKEFLKRYIVNNPYIKPKFLTEKIKIDNNDVKLEALKFESLINLEEINDLCKK